MPIPSHERLINFQRVPTLFGQPMYVNIGRSPEHSNPGAFWQCGRQPIQRFIAASHALVALALRMVNDKNHRLAAGGLANRRAS